MSTLTQDLAHCGATFVVVTSAAPAGPHERCELAAVVLRAARAGFDRVGRLHRALDPDAPAHLARERSGLRPDQIDDRAPAGVALADLDARLTRPPYIAVTYGPALGQAIAAHRGNRRALAQLPRLDVQRLQRHLGGHDRSPALRIAQPAPGTATPALPVAEQAAGLFEYLMPAAATHADLPGLRGLLEIARDEPAAPMPHGPAAAFGATQPAVGAAMSPAAGGRREPARASCFSSARGQLRARASWWRTL